MVTPQLDETQFEERLQTLCDFLVENPVLQKASRYAGWSSKYIWTLLKRSSDGDPKFLIRWPDRESEQRIQFCEAVMQARKMWKASFDGELRAAVSVGQPRVSTFQGEVVWQKDAEALAMWGGDTLEAKEAAWRLGGEDDYPYAHRINAKGKRERIPLILYEPAAASLKQHIARSVLPELYNPPEVRTISTEHSGRVLVVGAVKPPYARDYVAPQVADTPLKADLRARLAALRANGPANPVPLDNQGRRTIPPNLGGGSPTNDPAEGIGRGQKPQLDANGVPTGRWADPLVHRKHADYSEPGKGGYSMTTGKLT